MIPTLSTEIPGGSNLFDTQLYKIYIQCLQMFNMCKYSARDSTMSISLILFTQAGYPRIILTIQSDFHHFRGILAAR